MNVSVTDSLEEFVKSQVSSGMYASASEVVRAGLRLLREQEAKVSKAIALSLEQIERGEYSEMNDEFWDEMKQEVTNEIKKHSNSKSE